MGLIIGAAIIHSWKPVKFSCPACRQVDQKQNESTDLQLWSWRAQQKDHKVQEEKIDQVDVKIGMSNLNHIAQNVSHINISECTHLCSLIIYKHDDVCQ